jgi:hypothetical protein
MYTLATPEGVHANRCRSFLKNELQLQDRGIDYKEETSDDGFVTFIFMNVDEEEFRNIVRRLKAQGVSMIGVDDQLTERKIMKLTNLLKENPGYSNRRGPETTSAANPELANYPNSYSADNSGWVPVSKLETILEEWRNKYSSGYYRDPQHRADEYMMDIEELVDFWKNFYDEKEDNKNDKATTSLQEQKLRKIIRKIIKK